MPISRKNLIIAGAVGVAVFTVIVVVIVVLVNRSDSGKADPVIFKRCDGRSDPIEPVEISSCANSTKTGYCEFRLDSDITAKLDFTPMKDYDDLTVEFTDPSGELTYRIWVCSHEINCPMRAGRQEKLFFWLDRAMLSDIKSGEFKMNIYLPEQFEQNEVKEEVYCLQFPGKVV